MDTRQAVTALKQMAMKERDPRKLKNVLAELNVCGGVTAELLEHTMKCAKDAGDIEVLAWATNKHFRLTH